MTNCQDQFVYHQLGGRSVAFVESEIDTWIAERIAARHVG
ncbi:helix-turn-helix transcriptional regulator [Aeromonas veronii]